MIVLKMYKREKGGNDLVCKSFRSIQVDSHEDTPRYSVHMFHYPRSERDTLKFKRKNKSKLRKREGKKEKERVRLRKKESEIRDKEGD